MPPMHAAHAAAAGMPPPAFSSFSLISETMASVVSIRPAIDDALISAVLVTLAGSMTPAATRSSNLPVAALKPLVPLSAGAA